MSESVYKFTKMAMNVNHFIFGSDSPRGARVVPAVFSYLKLPHLAGILAKIVPAIFATYAI